MFRSSITRFLMLSFTVLMGGLLAASSIIAAQSWSRYALAGRIALLAQTDRQLFDALIAVRAQVPKVSTAMIDDDDPRTVIQDAHEEAEREVHAALRALPLTRLDDRGTLASNIRMRWEALETLQKRLRDEAARPRDARNLHDIDAWRQAVHATTDALSRASAAIGNEVRIGDPLVAEMVQIRRFAWIARDRYGLQCSMLRPNIAAGARLDAAELASWSADRAIYDGAWRSLDELLLRPGVSSAVRRQSDLARTATLHAQAQIDAIVGQLDDSGRAPIPGDRWTALCDGPFESILEIARQAQQEATQRAEELRAGALSMLRWAGLGLSASILFGVFALRTIQRRLARPMRSLIGTVARLTRRDLKDPVPIPRTMDELGRLSLALEDLRLSALEAERLQAAMSRFTADASHQMRTPLSVLRAHISVLQALIPPEAEARASLHDIEEAADRLQRLLIQLLNLARAEARRPADGLQETADLRRVIQEAAVSHAAQASQAGIELHFEAEDRPVATNANPTVIKEILGNLIDNAIRYNRAGGSVVVRLHESGSRTVVEVEDDGPGIPKSEYEKVFTRFYRLDRDQSRPGSGLGLAIVRSFAASLNAEIALSEGASGRGLRVRMTFA